MNRVHAPEAAAPSSAAINLDDPALYLSRELAQLRFNWRVLAQAQDESVPLLERLRYLSISCAILDEFFEVRVAILKQQLRRGEARPGPDAQTPAQVLACIRPEAATLVAAQHQFWQRQLLPDLAAQDIHFLTAQHCDSRQQEWLKRYFHEQVLPVLSPQGLDPAHPFPRILNKSLTLVVTLDGRDTYGREDHVALVRAPRSLPRIIRLPAAICRSGHCFVFLADILQYFVGGMFPTMPVRSAHAFRVTRNSELAVAEDEVENLERALRTELHGRGYARPVRLEVDRACPVPIADMLLDNFGLDEDDLYHCDGPVNINRIAAIYDQVDRPDLKFTPFTPRVPAALPQRRSLLQAIAERDILLHHPFDSFAPVVELLREASQDPDVLAIKQTLYRAGSDSPLLEHLVRAARNGKDVTVVIELRARFDEAANLDLANRLQEVGVQVVYGVVGLKTHAKMLLVVRREDSVLRRYVHLSTGNYHPRNSTLYTDFGLMTADPDIGADVHQLFLQLSGLDTGTALRCLLQSPFTLHAGLKQRIAREIDHQQAGGSGRIIAKMNALNEAGIIRSLYRASQAGVQIDLIVRGACALRPGVPGVSENIRVRSIVGRFLEHSRVFWFANNGNAELLCSSADWLERNLLRRIEVAFPIRDAMLAQRIFDEALANGLADNTHAWLLQPDGSWHRATPTSAQAHNAQQRLVDAVTP